MTVHVSEITLISIKMLKEDMRGGANEKVELSSSVEMEDLGLYINCIGMLNVILQVLFNRNGLYLDNSKTDFFYQKL